MTDKPTYEALEAQVSALTKEVSNLKESQRDPHVLNGYIDTFHETTMDLLEKRDLSDLLAAILTRVTGVFQTDTGFLYLLDEDENKLVLKVGQGHFAKRIGYRLDRGAGLAGKVLQTGEPIVVDDYSVWEGRVPDPFWDTLRSIAGFPIKIQNKTIGVIGIHQIRTEKAVSQDELDLIRRFADLASLGLKNAHLYELLQKELIDRKQAEEALREKERFHEGILNDMITFVAVLDSGGDVIFVNNTPLTVGGIELEDIIGKKFFDGFWWTHSDEVREMIKRDIEKCADGESIVHDVPIRTKDGSLMWIEFSMHPVYDEYGVVQYLIPEGREITAHKKAEEALRQSEEKYRLLIENATDAIFIAQDKVLRFANPKTEEITGYSVEELAKIPFVDIVHPEDRDMVLERHVKRLRGEEIPSIYSFRILNRSGEELSAELNAVLINWEGRPATLNFLRDITSQKKLEAQLQQAQKMEAIGTLAGGIAHDFNNLLMAIQGRTSIMRMSKDSSHPDFEHLKGVEDHVKSAADLTRQLLGFARGGKYEVRPADLNELIKKQNRMFGRTKKEINIDGKYQENLWSVKVDRGQIEQVMLNLYVNAWQAMPGGGSLYLETENVIIEENYVKSFSIEPGRYVKISVTDTGVGMDKATQKKIFDPFFTTKEMGRGTGLGLASSYGIVKNHGGFINVYSEKGHGTTFNIYLPASAKEIIEEKQPSGDILRGSETVLFVDDEDMIIEVAEELFKELGYKVLIARGGKEAVEIYEKNKGQIDIVVLDMIMPDMSGSMTYDRMKEIDPDIKVLLASGYSIDGQATEILDRGYDGFIQKPFKIKELSQKLREILDDK